MMRHLTLILLLAGVPIAGSAADVFVSAAAGGTADGHSWANACPTLTAGLALATAGDRVWIAQGSYTPGNQRTSTFTVPDGVSVYGGFIGNETAFEQRVDDPSLVVLTGEIGAAGYNDNINRLVTLNGSARLDTLTVTMASYEDASTDDAAGLRGTTTGASVTLERCRFTANRAYGPQVILIENALAVLIERCEVSNAFEPGFDQRSVGTVWLKDCVSAHIVRSVFTDITPASTLDLTSAVTFSNCATATVESCVFANCQTVSALTDGDAYGCTFVGNRGRNIFGGGSVRGCLVEPTTVGQTIDDPTITNPTIIENNWITSVDGDPKFTDRALPAGPDGIWFTADDGLALQADSPCIDHARFITPTTRQGMPVIDLLGTARPQGHDPDCGAYEYITGNTAPFARGGTSTLDEDQLTPVLLDGTDADGDPLSATVLSLPSRGLLFPTADGVHPSSAALIAADLPWMVAGPGAQMLYLPQADSWGTAFDAFQYQVADRSTASYPATRVIEVRPVNDAPTLTAPSAQTILEDSGQHDIALTGISAGTPGLADGDPSKEVQTLTITAVSSDPSRIPNPTVSYTSPAGTAQLSYAPAPDATGDVELTITVHDDGGTASGGTDTTIRTCAIHITPVNDPPRMITDPVVSILEDAGAFTFLIRDLSPGPTDESGQTVSVIVTSAKPDVVAVVGVDPIQPDGTALVHLATQADQFGDVVIFVGAFDDGGIANGGSDSSAQTVLIQVAPVDDPPRLTVDAGLGIAAGGQATLTPAMLELTDPDPSSTTLTFTLTALPARGTLLLDGVPLTAGETFTQAQIASGSLAYRQDGLVGSNDGFPFTWTDGDTPVQGPATFVIAINGSHPPVLTLPHPAVDWTERMAPVLLAADAGVTDADGNPWDGGGVIATIAGGAQAGDLLTLDDHPQDNRLQVVDGTIFFAGVAVGSWSRNPDGTVLVVSLAGTQAGPAAAQAVVRALQYASTSRNPGSATRTIDLQLNDGLTGLQTPSVVQVAVTPINDAPAVLTTFIAVPAGATIDAQLQLDDPDGPTATWSLIATPGHATVSLSDPSTGRLHIVTAVGATGQGTITVQVSDGVAPAVQADIALWVTAGDTPRPEPVGELPPEVYAGGTLDSTLRFDTTALGGTSGLNFQATSDAPSGLTLTPVGSDRVRIQWNPPSTMAAPAYLRFAITAADPASRSAGLLPVLLLVRPQPGGGG